MSRDYFIDPAWGCQLPRLADIYKETFGYREQGYFVEVGAYDAVNWSDTRVLALLGWHGIYVEPVPDFAARCRENCKDLPNIQIVEGCCGDHGGEVTVYRNGTLTSLDPLWIEFFPGRHPSRPFQAQMYRLETLLEKHSWPKHYDVLVVDTEGTELDVLLGANLEEWHPTLAIVETHDTRDDRLERQAIEIDNLMVGHGYESIYDDRLNRVYRRRGR